jgi:hypothetical protein
MACSGITLPLPYMCLNHNSTEISSWWVWDGVNWRTDTFGQVPNSVEKSLYWEANSRSANQYIRRLTWNTEVHYHVHKSLPLVHIHISHMIPVQPSNSIFRIRCNIILLPMPRSSGLFPSDSPIKSVYAFHISHVRAACPAYPILLLFDHPNNIPRREQIMELLIMQFCPCSCHFKRTRFLLSLNTQTEK